MKYVESHADSIPFMSRNFYVNNFITYCTLCSITLFDENSVEHFYKSGEI